MSKDVKLSKRCQNVQKMSLSKWCQMSKNQTTGLGRRFTTKIDTMKFTHNDVNFC